MTDFELWKMRAEAAGTVVAECADATEAAAYIARLAEAIRRNEPRRDLISGEAAANPVVAVPAALEPAPLADIIRQCLEPGTTCVARRLRQYAGGMDLGVAAASALVADTGSCVLDGTDEDIRLATMLPDISVLLAPAGAVLPDLAAARSVLKHVLAGDTARHVTFITGPSRTADIERVLTLGVHGPLELHVLVMPDDTLRGIQG